MTAIAPYIEAFLREHLGHHRGASRHTCDSYAYSFQLLFEFAARRFQVVPSALKLEQLDAELIGAFSERFRGAASKFTGYAQHPSRCNPLFLPILGAS